MAGVKDQFGADINTNDLWAVAVLMSLVLGFVNAYNYEPARAKEKNNFWKHHDEYGSIKKQENSKKASHSTEQQRNTEADLIKGLIEESPNTHDALLQFIPHMHNHYKTLKRLSKVSYDEQENVSVEFFRLYKLTLDAMLIDEILIKGMKGKEACLIELKYINQFSKAYPNYPNGYLYARQYFTELGESYEEENKKQPSKESSKPIPMTVDTDIFLAAVSQLSKMKRAPNGARNKSPKDTILTPEIKGMNVETPVMSTFVSGNKALNQHISVDAVELYDVVCKHAGKKGKAIRSETLDIWVGDNKLWLKGYFLASLDAY